MNGNRSVATIDNPEFIDIHPYNPLISECKIKVLYLGRNRNRSFIDKNTAIQMANSLPGTPIVGVWREDKDDYGDHGHVMTIEDGQVKFSCKTVPYGFVAPNARVWFQKFIDTDEFGEETEREYLMTTGYLWTGQFEEAMSVIEDGKGQSMELDEKTLDGHWANDNKTGLDFFIINDALFSKLCILGDDVEPCFEGASITSANSDYAKDSDFAASLYTMMKELKDALENHEGGLNMPEDYVATSVDTESAQEDLENAVDVEEVEQEASEEEETEAADDSAVETEEETEIEDEGEDSEDADADSDSDSSDDDSDTDFVQKEDEDSPEDEEEDDTKPETDSACGDKKKYSLSDEDIDSMMEELAALREFKLSIENKEKDALIAKYHMLSDEDKADVVAHKEEYTMEQIDEKLALVYVRKNVDFSTVDGHKEEEREEDVESLLSFSLNDENNGNAEIVSDIQAAFRDLNN